MLDQFVDTISNLRNSLEWDKMITKSVEVHFAVQEASSEVENKAAELLPMIPNSVNEIIDDMIESIAAFQENPAMNGKKAKAYMKSLILYNSSK